MKIQLDIKQLEEIANMVASTIWEKLENKMVERDRLLNKKMDSIDKEVSESRQERKDDFNDISSILTATRDVNQGLRDLGEKFSHQTSTIVTSVSNNVLDAVGDSVDAVKDAVQPTIEHTMNKFVEKQQDNLKPKKKRRFLGLLRGRGK